MKIRNRSTSIVCYSVPDLNVRREFSAGEVKEIPQNELEALIQQTGGRVILTEYLQVSQEDIAKLDVMTPEQEYFYSDEDVKRIMTAGSLDMFLDMLDFAPEGVLDMIKTYSVELPLTDLRKINALRDKIGFDAAKAIENSQVEATESAVTAPKRRVSESEAPATGRRVVSTPEYKIISDN